MEYLKRVIAASKASDVDQIMDDEQAAATGGQTSITVNVPGAGGAMEESKDATMDDLLAGYEEDLGIEHSNDIDGESSAAIAQEVNLLKQASE